MRSEAIEDQTRTLDRALWTPLHLMAGGNRLGEWPDIPMIFSHHDPEKAKRLINDAGFRLEQVELVQQDNEKLRPLDRRPTGPQSRKASGTQPHLVPIGDALCIHEYQPLFSGLLRGVCNSVIENSTGEALMTTPAG